MVEALHIKGLDVGDVDPATVCQVHDWPSDGLARRLVDAMRETHGKGGINVCIPCIERAKAALPPRGPTPGEELAKEMGRRDAERAYPKAEPPPPVDRSARCTVGEAIAPGVANTEGRGDGQQKGYVILCDGERRRGFVRPVRSSYIHEKCGTLTTMGRALSETYARDPGFYSGTFCCGCRAHFPVGADGEFHWEDGTKVGT
jgi:hypothetical protein